MKGLLVIGACPGRGLWGPFIFFIPLAFWPCGEQLCVLCGDFCLTTDSKAMELIDRGLQYLNLLAKISLFSVLI
jgi:hypothetical protein